MPDVHSKLSPSSAHRWLACPGSLEGVHAEDRTSEYAAEGTIAHSLAHQCWMTGAEPEMFIGQARHCDGHPFEINQEMADAVRVYLDFIEGAAGDDQVLTERRVEHSFISDFGGTIDCVLPTTQHIVDFKYGAGIPVEVHGGGEGSHFGWNVQLACYAILFRDHFEVAGDITVSIVQPRAAHPDGPIRTATIPGEELADLTLRIAEVAEGGRAEELNAGDHCRWCPRAANCPELYELTLTHARAEFGEEEELTSEKAAEILGLRKAITSYFDAVEEVVHGRLEKGQSVPGYKLVDRFGQRRYAVGEETVVKKCRGRKIGKKQIYESKLLSPAQLEKVAGKELVSSLVERPHLGTTVVPESDRRPAVTRVTAAEEFGSEEEAI